MAFTHRQIISAATAASLGLTGLTGCASLSNSEKGAIIGTATGGAIVAAVGSHAVARSSGKGLPDRPGQVPFRRGGVARERRA